MSGATIALLGNPNCGKTTLFNALTGTRQMVGNWPGVTVEKKTGEIRFAGRTAALVDLPGTYSLGSGHTVSTDERIARDFALSGEAQLVVNIVDASNIERNLYPHAADPRDGRAGGGGAQHDGYRREPADRDRP